MISAFIQIIYGTYIHLPLKAKKWSGCIRLIYCMYNCRCTLQIKQKGDTKADSNLRAQDGMHKKLISVQNITPVTAVGKWNNLFTAVMMLTNTGDSDLAITNMEGYYCTTGGWGLLVGVAVKWYH